MDVHIVLISIQLRQERLVKPSNALIVLQYGKTAHFLMTKRKQRLLGQKQLL